MDLVLLWCILFTHIISPTPDQCQILHVELSEQIKHQTLPRLYFLTQIVKSWLYQVLFIASNICHHQDFYMQRPLFLKSAPFTLLTFSVRSQSQILAINTEGFPHCYKAVVSAYVYRVSGGKSNLFEPVMAET